MYKLPFFEEFKVNGEMEFFEFNFNPKYDGLIGNNILTKLNCTIDYPNRLIILPNTTIPFFLTKEEEEYDETLTTEICSMESIAIQTNIINNPIFEETINEIDKEKVFKVIHKYEDIFYKEGTNLSFTNEVKHRINTLNDIPIYSKLYRYPEIHKEEVNKQIHDMLQQGIIRPSVSPYNSPIWVVPKKIDNSGKQKWRIVIDFRKLNEITVTDRFPIPNIEDIFDKLGRAQYFSIIDLAKGFHQIEMDPKDIKKTAFSTASGHYEFLRMPFGLKNAPATFQRMVNNVLCEYIGKICLVYLDDIIIFSTSIEEHLDSLHKVFQRLRRANLKMQIDKCKFLARETEFLGHIVTADGIKTNPNKIEAIKKIPLPRTQKEIKSFLGITGYYRKFIKDYSKIAHDIVKYLKKDAKINVNDPSYISSFNKLKTLLQTDPILTHPDFKIKFTLITDASNFALGAVLMQQNKTIAYASRSLNDHEKNYSTIEKELLGIVWAVKYFRPYLFGRKFTIKTDHRPLIWLNGLKEPNSKLQHWKIQLNEYNFDIEYIKGKENFVADGLSRIITATDVQINANTIHEVEVQSVIDNHNDDDSTNMSIENEVDDLETIHSADTDVINFIPISEKPLNLFKNQIIISFGNEKSDNISKIFEKTRRQVTISNEAEFLEVMKNILPPKGMVAVYIKNDSLFLQFQDLYREFFANNKLLKVLRCTRIITDITDREELLQIIENAHTQNNHRGIQEIIKELKNTIYHPNLIKEIHKFINKCEICNVAKYDRRPLKHNLNITETPNNTNEIVHFDVWFPQRQVMYLTSIDKFSKYATAHYLNDRTWISILEALKNRTQYLGRPNKIVIDNELNTATLKEYVKNNNIELQVTIPYCKTGNADIERLHLTLNEHLRLYNADPNNNLDLNEKVHNAILAYNNTIHTTHNKRPIDFLNNKISQDEIKLIKQKLHDKKTENINKNNERHNNENIPDFSNQYVKNYRAPKAQPKYKKIDNYKKSDNHLILDKNNRKYYKTQVKRKFKYQ